MKCNCDKCFCDNCFLHCIATACCYIAMFSIVLLSWFSASFRFGYKMQRGWKMGSFERWEDWLNQFFRDATSNFFFEILSVGEPQEFSQWLHVSGKHSSIIERCEAWGSLKLRPSPGKTHKLCDLSEYLFVALTLKTLVSKRHSFAAQCS